MVKLKLHIIVALSFSFVLSSHSIAFSEEQTEASLTRMERDLNEKSDEIKQLRLKYDDVKTVDTYVGQIIDGLNKTTYPIDLKSKIDAINKLINSIKDKDPIEQKTQEQLNNDFRDADRQFKLPLKVGDQGNVDELFTAEQKRILAQAFREEPPSPETVLGTGSGIFDFLELTGRHKSSKFFREDRDKSYLDKSFANDFLQSINEDSFSKQRQKITSYFVEHRKTLTDRADETQNKLRLLEGDTDKLIQLIDKSRDQSTRINEALITFAVPSLGILMLLLIVAPRFYKDEKLHLEIFQSGLLLELFTVFFITSTILILGLGKRIDSNVLGTLLGGISGYVLGRSIKDNKSH
jgi:hypothetical protein